MLKFIRGKGQQPSAERLKLQRELFAFRKTVQHGFPNKPSALAWDPLLRLMALGTSSGALKVLGQPGVELYGQHAHGEAAVTALRFLPGAAKLVALCDDNSLHLWEAAAGEGALVELRQVALEGKLKRVSALCVEAASNRLLLGTEGGNIYQLALDDFTMTDDIIYQDVVVQSCPEDYKLNPGAVECLSEHPHDPRLLLIGYNRGLLVVWDRQANSAQYVFASNRQLESVCWHASGEAFTSSHNDGSHKTWELSASPEKELKEPVTVYGPFPCKAVTKLLQRTTPDGEDITIFSGGMPRSSYSDKYTVTVIHGDKHVVFDFTSRVIDFFTTSPLPDDDQDPPLVTERPRLAREALPCTLQQPAGALIVLAEEELVAIDLQDPGLRLLRLPYLVSLHASAVTCQLLLSVVDPTVYQTIKDAGVEQSSALYSGGRWPISGGQLLCAKPAEPEQSRQLLLTGHEDGSVAFWDATSVTLDHLYKFTTSNLFRELKRTLTSGEEISEGVDSPGSGGEDSAEEEWPPFRKTGAFDPYSDDPRLAVKKLALCPLSGTLLVAGTAGHVVAATVSAEAGSVTVKSAEVNLVSDRDSFVWKGHSRLRLRAGPVSCPAGFQASSVLQVLPPAAITCCALQPEWGLLAAGTAHGLALYDYRQHRPTLQRCTLNPNDLTGSGDTPISRRKSFKKSLRESFRRLRKGRSQRRTTGQDKNNPAAPNKSETISPAEARPVERQIEARPADDSDGSMVRCLTFVRTFLVSVQSTVPTLWAGTNNGTVYVFTVSIPPSNRRAEDPVTCQLAKEIQLKHRAPVIGITVLDGAAVPLPEPLEVERGVSPLADSTQPHRVIIASEEQFKIFSLPSLKPYCKYKLTAHEGARVRRMSFAQFSCPVTEAGGKVGKHTEVCLLCLTNLGDCLVLSVPDLRRQLNAAAVRKEDINGISSLTFSRWGEALYLHSSSELQRITVSAAKVTRARCYLTLPAWAKREEQEAALTNGETKESMVNGDSGVEDNQHNVTVSSSMGDITVDSVKDHLLAALGSPEGLANMPTINLQSSCVSQSSVLVKTTTLTTLANSSGSGQPAGTTEASTTTTTHHSQHQDNILEHSREEGQITRIETSTVTVPMGTDPKLILEMFERSRSPLQRHDDQQTETITVTEAH